MTRVAQTYPQLAVQIAGLDWPAADLASLRASFDLAATLFSAHDRGCGKPFLDHLVGTASAVLIGGGSPTTARAALLHAAYDFGDWGDNRPGAHDRHRAQVATVAGRDAEEMVFGYHRLGWNRDAATRSLAEFERASAAERAVLLIRVANEVDEAVDGGLVMSGKGQFPNHDAQMGALVVELAEQVATPELIEILRTELVGPQPGLPPELIVGRGGGRVRLPRSARLSTRIRFHRGVRRVGRRLARIPKGVVRRLR